MKAWTLTAALVGAGVCGAARGQDARDQEIFGGSEPTAPGAPTEAPGAASAVTPAPPSTAASLVDTLQIGGRLELRATSAQAEDQRFQEASLQRLKQADLYFDSRPHRHLRAFLRARLSETTPAPAVSAAVPSDPVRQELDELWLKWTYADAVFFTAGKQHLKWGSGRIWNPTDFTATTPRDPLALFDRRLGQELLKVHVPDEQRAFNYYAVLQFDETERNDDVGLALRGEFALLGQAEAAVSFQTRRRAAQRLGLDLSTGLGPVDVNVESALSTREGRTFYRGDLEPETGALPEAYQDEDERFSQTVGGVSYTWKYSDEDSFNVGAEYFMNGLGYASRELELYALVRGDATPLAAGRRYAGAYARLPKPGSWNRTSFYLNGLRNLTDKTALVRLAETWELLEHATIEVFASRCFGDFGELCFRIPEEYQALAASPFLGEAERQTLAALPTKRTVLTTGVGITANF